MSETKQEAAAGPSIVLAEFDGAAALFSAAEKLRDAGYREFDCHSPFPIHGMDRAMGIKRSPLAFIVFACAFSAVFFMIWLTYYVGAVDYKLVISGKPFFSYQAYAPPIFAMGVLTGAITAVLGMMALNRLPRLHHSLFRSKNFERVTTDGFFVSVQSDDPQYDETRVKAFLASIGGKNVEVLRDE
jgi:hypothetical protein